MDVESKETISAEIAEAKAAGQDLLQSVNQIVAAQLGAAATQLSSIVKGAILGAQAIEDKAQADLSSLVLSLDGWTVEIGPITVPAISIRLTKPKGENAA